MYVAKIRVTLKKSVLDPQGKTVLHALQSMGFHSPVDVRAGKYLEVSLASRDKDEAAAEVKNMCDQLLINPVIEEYTYELEEKR